MSEGANKVNGLAKSNVVNIGIMRVKPLLKTEIQGQELLLKCDMAACLKIYETTGIYLMLNLVSVALLLSPGYHFEFASAMLTSGGNSVTADNLREVMDAEDVFRVSGDMKELIEAFLPSTEQMDRITKLAAKDPKPESPNQPPTPISLESGVSDYEDSDLLPKISGE